MTGKCDSDNFPNETGDRLAKTQTTKRHQDPPPPPLEGLVGRSTVRECAKIVVLSLGIIMYKFAAQIIWEQGKMNSLYFFFSFFLFFFAVILRLVDEENVVFDEFSVASSDLGFIAFYWVGFTVAQS